MGWLCVHHKFNTFTRVRIVIDGTFLESFVHQLHDVLHIRSPVLYADTVCGFSTDKNERTYGSVRYVTNSVREIASFVG